MKKMIITEEEKNRILGLHSLTEQFDTTLFDKNKESLAEFEKWFEKQNFSDPMSLVPIRSKSGDTLETIAKAWNMRIEDIKANNPKIGDGPIPPNTTVKVKLIDNNNYNVLPPNRNQE